MRCPRCDHDNPRRVSHCEVCGTPLGAAPAPAPILSPGHRQTAFEPAPVLPPLGQTPAATPAPPAAAPPAVPPGFGPLPPPVPSSYGASGPNAPRRTVAEPSPALPPRTGGAPPLAPSPAAASLASTLPLEAPPWVDPPRPAVAPAAANPAGTMPSGVPAYDQRSSLPGIAGTVPMPPGAHAAPSPTRPSNPAIPPQAAPAAPFAPAPRPIAAPRPLEATHVAQGPELGALPLRGALFEYRGVGHQGFIHTLRAGRNVIGRDPAVCDVVLEGDKVSKQHAFLFIRGDDVSLLDISANGTLVDGRTVHGAEAHLRSPSVIEIGGSRLVFLLVPRQLIDGGP